MSYKPNDSLQKQIENGEVWFWSDEDQGLTDAENKSYLITTGTKPCSVIFEIHMPKACQLFIQVFENPTSITGSSARTLYNMRRDSASSIQTTIEPSSSRSGGTEISDISAFGRLPANSATSREVGLILKANEEYVYEFTNYSGTYTELSYSVFFREID